MRDQFKELRQAILKSANTNSLGVVTAVDRVKGTVNVQPVINTLFKDGSELPQPIIEDVPVWNYGNSNSLVLAPLSVDDIVILCYTKDFIQEYLDSADFRNMTPSDRRFMDTSDVIAFPSNIKRVNNPSDVRNHSLTYEDKSFIIKHNIGKSTESQIELKDDGSINLSTNNQSTSVILNSDGTITFSADSKIILDSEVEITQGLEVSKDVGANNVKAKAEVTAGSVGLTTHTHSYTWTDGPGSGTTLPGVG